MIFVVFYGVKLKLFGIEIIQSFKLGDNGFGLSGDRKLFISRNDPHCNFGVFLRNPVVFATDKVGVSVLVKINTKIIQK